MLAKRLLLLKQNISHQQIGFMNFVQPFSSKNDLKDIPRPQHSTSAEGFAKKFSEKEVEKLLDPMGFVDKKDLNNYDGLTADGKLKKALEENPSSQEKTFNYDNHNVKPHIKEMPQEYGFKVTGRPEPTRYGDWEKKGRVSDF